MKRIALIVPMLAVLAACPRDKNDAEPIAVDTAQPVDTTPQDLSQVAADLPPVAPDTFTRRRPSPQPPRAAGRIPDAPAALMAAVEREEALSRFCYQEFGLKADPTLSGGVSMVVTVSSRGSISGVRVGADNWSSRAGKAVNQCLSEKARQAWEVTPGSVKPGEYVVPLRFRGT